MGLRKAEMPKKYFIIRINNDVAIQVAFETAHGLIVSFVVKLILKKDDRYYEVIRFDSGHSCPHKDVLNHEGAIVRKVWYDFFDNKQTLDLAIKDLKENYESYIERFDRL
jgi:hypothetical protein